MVVLLGFLITKQVKIVMYFRNIIIFHEKRNYVFKNRNYVFIKSIYFFTGMFFVFVSFLLSGIYETAENC